MKINNKEFGEWTADDLQVLLSNDAYRENNFIDYKVNFAPLIDKSNKKEKQAEFRNDVCSFANADGGYIFYGIGETSGVASILAGISIPNIDRFELDRRNELQAIRPTVPDVAFSFISLQDDKYIVVLHIQRGLYKPYITEEPEGQFHFYIRHGNKKQAMSYTEIRNGFLNAAMLSEDIKSFRKERLEEHITEMKKPFALVQVIPATFRSDCVPMYDLYREGKLNFDDLFNGMIYDRAVPNVDGVYLQSLRAEYSNQQVDYSIAEQLDFTAYEAALPNFSNQTQYNSKIEERGSFRKKCKQVAEKIALELSQQLNITVKEVYRYSYKFAVENIPENELNVRALLAQTMKRVR